MKKMKLLIGIIVLSGSVFLYSTFVNDEILFQDKVFNSLSSLDWLDEEIFMYEKSNSDIYDYGEGDFQNVAHSFTNGNEKVKDAISEENVLNYYHYSLSNELSDETLISVILQFDSEESASEAYKVLVVTDPVYTSTTIMIKDNYLISAFFNYTQNSSEQPGVIYLQESLQD